MLGHRVGGIGCGRFEPQNLVPIEAEHAAKTLNELLIKAAPALEEREKSARSANLKKAEEFCPVARAILSACVVHRHSRRVELQSRTKLTTKQLAAFGLALIGG
jgi:hypothetical protein